MGGQDKTHVPGPKPHPGHHTRLVETIEEIHGIFVVYQPPPHRELSKD